MKNAEIAVLVEKARQSESGFNELYGTIWGQVYYYCYKMLGNKQDAEDATQTVFLSLHKNLSEAYDPKSFNKLLYTTMRGICLNFHNKKVRNQTEEIDDFDSSLFEENAKFLPAKALENEEWRNQVVKLIRELPDKQKEAIVLFYFYDKSVKEIAEITESKVDAVKNRLVEARKKIKEHAEVLIKEGIMDKTMAIAPTPILTQILQADAAQMALPEIGEAIWARVAKEIDLSADANTAEPSANQAQPQAQAAAGQGAAAASTAATVGVNIAITVSILVAIGILAYGGYHVNQTFIQPLIAAGAAGDQAPFETTTLTVAEIVPLIREIETRTEFVDFILTYGFDQIGGNRSSISGDHVLYFLEHEDSFIYLGYLTDVEGNFRVVYQITDNTMPQIQSSEVRNWFFAR